MGKEERKIESYLVKEVKRLGGFCRKYTSPGQKGVPDRICFLPRGLVWLVETKTEIGKLSVLQKREIARLRKQGILVSVIYSSADVDKTIQAMHVKSMKLYAGVGYALRTQSNELY